jgi:uncharacterized coiled-coil DUF342 family protein
MTNTEMFTLVTMALQTVGLGVVLFKLVWGGATSHHETITASHNALLARIELQSSNIGNVTANISDRIHQLELAAMETRAVTAETYMRRDSYQKAADEFKRDVRDAHDDLKQQMHAGFDELKEQITAVSMSIEENRKARRSD